MSWFVVDVVDHVDAELPKPKKKFNEILLREAVQIPKSRFLISMADKGGRGVGGGRANLIRI